ncbi:hypothetical protein LLS1_03250 [Leifsonia sp. LS1]|uniref:TOPRIM nucleotidyl transferase/hydrolase domain-containing protein n=1 Tax=Leifsonia sp. LS1 TaxID=2828483 RepID=UPI001CFECBFA|nr:TOPRIM nucleotidyl transferase/hydrolase domain-containing protein [Leifsonia sp. LS1]GIT78656.1 hypothetical protein LLS1_03250 [Leifsonia sp. LS1]
MTGSAPRRGEAAASAAAELESALAHWAAGGGTPSADAVSAVRVVLLVEGASDRAAVLTAAVLLGRDLGMEGVAVVPMGGAMSARRFAEALGPRRPTGGDDAPATAHRPEVRGLCDAAERRFFERAGIPDPAIAVCRPDLEGELIEALGIAGTEEVLAQEGDLRLFRTFQNQPAQRARTPAQQLHRFFGTTSGRKERYGRALTAALTAERLPAPLVSALLGDEEGSDARA